MVITNQSHEFKTSNGNILKTALTEVDTAQRLVLVAPGAQASVNGENENDDRYTRLARTISKELGCSIIRFSNDFRPDYGYFDEEPNMHAMLAKTAEVVGDRAVTGFGFSAGARMLAEYAHELEAIDKLVIVNPDPGFEPEKAVKGFAEFTGNLRIVTGSKDDEERLAFASELFEAAASSPKVRQYLPGVDHMFTDSIDQFVALGKCAG